MKVTLDLDQLLNDEEITQTEYESRKGDYLFITSRAH